jgi:cell division protein ZapE
MVTLATRHGSAPREPSPAMRRWSRLSLRIQIGLHSMDLVHAYDRLCFTRGLTADTFQREAAAELQAFANPAVADRSSAQRGLYLWGPVGRGKTMLMDLFFEHLDAPKTRIHFHAMMRRIRDRLAQLSGTANPLSIVASELAPPGHVLCIDEFHVSDVDNALVLEVLLKELLSSRTVIVTTSNFSPDDLVDDALGLEFRRNNADSPIDDSGLFRTSKAETVRLLKKAFRIWRIGGSTDYRVSKRAGLQSFVDGDAADARAILQRRFSSFASGLPLEREMTVFGRPINCVARSHGALWFEYREICEGNYSYRDYLKLLEGIRGVVVQDVNVRTIDGAKRLAWLVEVIYDARIDLVLSGSGGFEKLFDDIKIPSHLMLEMHRVRSRIYELTSRV